MAFRQVFFFDTPEVTKIYYLMAPTCGPLQQKIEFISVSLIRVYRPFQKVRETRTN